MSNKERTLFNSLIKVMLRSTWEEGSGFYTCVCVRSFGILGKEKKISKSRLVRFTCVCVCVCDRAVDRGERVNLCKSKWWMEGECHLPREPQSLSLEIKVFSFSVSLTRQRKNGNLKKEKPKNRLVHEASNSKLWVNWRKYGWWEIAS